MKSVLKVFAGVLVLMLAVAAVAGDFSHLRISKDVTVAGTKLAAGDYNVKIDGAGPDVKVIFQQDGKVRATVDGKLEQVKEVPEYSSVVMEKTDDGQKVSELRLARTKGYVKF